MRNMAGEVLRNPSILAFDGAVFDVSHDGGVAKVPWERMPEPWRRGYAYDTDAAVRAAETRARATDTARRSITEPEVIVAGKSLGWNHDRKVWVVLPLKVEMRLPNGSPPSEPDLRRLPAMVPQPNQIVVIPAAEVPPAWQKDQFVLCKARLLRRVPMEGRPDTTVNHVRELVAWSDPLISITPAPPPPAEAGR